MNKRKIEIYSAGCPACADTVELVNSMVCGSCSVEILYMTDDNVAERARQLDIRAVPAVVVDGTLLDCCEGGVNKSSLEAAGIGQPNG